MMMSKLTYLAVEQRPHRHRGRLAGLATDKDGPGGLEALEPGDELEALRVADQNLEVGSVGWAVG